MEIRLKNPIDVFGDPVEVLTIKDKVQVKHLKAMDEAKGDIGKLAALISALADIPSSSVDQLSAEDFTVISEAMAGFLPQSRPTGATS